MTTKSDANIAALAALFPAAFSAEPGQAHRPLKVGIGNDLVARGVLGVQEVNAALKRYVDRLMYQKCLADGGARVDLEGNVSGEVSREQRCRADKLVLRINAHQPVEAAAAEAESKRAIGQTATPPSVLNANAAVMPPHAQTATGSGRLGLAGLKRAALERRAREETGLADRAST